MILLRNIFKLIFVYCPVLFVVILVAAVFGRNMDSIGKDFAQFVSKTSSDFLNVNCSVKKITVKGLDVTLEDVYLEDTKGKPMLTVDNLYFRINVASFSSGKFQLSKFIADNAIVNVSRSGDKWNFDFLLDLFKKKEVENVDIREPIIIVKNSCVNIDDSKFEYRDHLKNLNIRMDLRDSKNYIINGSVDSDFVKNIKAYTNIDNHSKKIKLKTLK